MDVNDGGKRLVKHHRAIGQYPDRLGAKRTLDVDFAGRDVGQVRFRNSVQQRKRINATPAQCLGGQRHLWPLLERVAQFGIDKFDCSHGYLPRPV
jgi:hypothetical protein